MNVFAKDNPTGGENTCSRFFSLVLLLRLLLLRDLLVAEEHLPQLLADVAELVLVLADELGNGGLRDVAELVVGVAREVAHHLGGEVAELVLLAQVSRDPLRSPC